VFAVLASGLFAVAENVESNYLKGVFRVVGVLCVMVGASLM
jgi:hypothetical protein